MRIHTYTHVVIERVLNGILGNLLTMIISEKAWGNRKKTGKEPFLKTSLLIEFFYHETEFVYNTHVIFKNNFYIVRKFINRHKHIQE